jgi:glycosyltransferase involved in cell wall biosynthesis
MTISVVIPTKNGGGGLAQCLAAVRGQELGDQVELVVIDSGSDDDTVEVARGHGAVVWGIPPSEFTHGRARNYGASCSTGEVLVFLSQDATPTRGDWLERLTEPLRDRPDLAGVYGRQLAHPHARPPEVFFLDFLYGPKPRIQRASGASELSMDTTLFSNVNAAIPRWAWERFPFAEDIIMSEDQEWSRRVLLDGFALRYEPSAAVRHSHDYTLAAAFRRFFDSGVSAERSYLAGREPARRVLRASAVRYAREEILWLAREGRRRWIPYAALYESAKFAGLVLGANHRRLPATVKRRFSALPSHWEREAALQ